MVLFIDFDSMEFACKHFGWYQLFVMAHFINLFLFDPALCGIDFDHIEFYFIGRCLHRPKCYVS